MAEPEARCSPQVGVVVITYNSGRVIERCLQRLSAMGLPTILVDNQSTDETLTIAANFPVTVHANARNTGFAAAANQGIAALRTPFVLLLNPDVFVERSPATLLHHFDNPTMGAVAATLTGPDGQPQSQFQFRRFPTPLTLLFETMGLNRFWPGNPVNRRYRYHGQVWDQPGPVDQPAGAFLLIRKIAWDQVDGFDERFAPLWFEDVDFCLRLWRNGWTIWRTPDFGGAHLGGHSIAGLEPGRRRLYWYRSLLLYVAKHFSSSWVRLMALSIVAGIGVRAIGGWMRRGPEAWVEDSWPTLALAARTVLHGRRQFVRRAPSFGGPRQDL